jgi:hypothetical protein
MEERRREGEKERSEDWKMEIKLFVLVLGL